ncbi:transferase family protein [Klebsormidium nitens]|uniref:Transferase family protein n=1 Tax=Klebsormidium nitens TaxID=105231 RepID=A0A1Y1HVT0_KLENI|nr:transferase family protein [Klebsormidium nitens]|eukprot:GAQ81091.1 transferase family protein [Klebsormidium nitens]
MDMWLFRTHYPPIIVFLPPLPKETTLDAFVAKCQATLAEALAAVPPLAGRFVVNAGGHLAVDCNDEGIHLRVAEANCPLPQRLASGLTINGTEQLHFEVPGTGGNVPLLLMQITRFQDDRLCISMGFHHTFTYGYGAFAFCKYWMHLMRGEKPPYKLEYARLKCVEASGCPVIALEHPTMGNTPFMPFSKTVKDLLGFAAFCAVFPVIPRSLLYTATVYHRFHFPTAQLKELKAEVNQGLPAGDFVSTNDAVCALLWRGITNARELAKQTPAQVTHCVFAMNGRNIVPDLPEGYVGNVHIPNRTEGVTAAELCEQPVSWSAKLIRNVVKRASPQFVQDMVDWVSAQPNIDSVGPRTDHHLGPDVVISSVSGLPLSELDFGFGRPLSLGVAKYSVPFDGFVLVTSYGAGFCADVSVLGPTMEALLADDDISRFTWAPVGRAEYCEGDEWLD